LVRIIMTNKKEKLLTGIEFSSLEPFELILLFSVCLTLNNMLMR
jgi:hypothetical protein